MPTRAITSGTIKGKAIAPARGVMATNQRSRTLSKGSATRPGFAGGVAVVFGGLTPG